MSDHEAAGRRRRAGRAPFGPGGTHTPGGTVGGCGRRRVDDDSRAKSLGLLVVFDLAVVMTSEREWGCYPQAPGLAIAQLSRVDEIPAVLVTRWEWDGRHRVLVDDGVSAPGSAPGSAAVEEAVEPGRTEEGGGADEPGAAREQEGLSG